MIDLGFGMNVPEEHLEREELSVFGYQHVFRLLPGRYFLRKGMSLWPPYWGAGIVVEAIRSDYRECTISLRDRLVNRNYFGTHFGGSLYAMTDPFFVLMVTRNIGSRYFVWDRAAQIEFVKPGTGHLRTVMHISEAEIATIQEATKGGSKWEGTFVAEVCDLKGELVAKVHKTVYVRLKPKYRPAGSATETRTPRSF